MWCGRRPSTGALFVILHNGRRLCCRGVLVERQGSKHILRPAFKRCYRALLQRDTHTTEHGVDKVHSGWRRPNDPRSIRGWAVQHANKDPAELGERFFMFCFFCVSLFQTLDAMFVVFRSEHSSKLPRLRTGTRSQLSWSTRSGSGGRAVHTARTDRLLERVRTVVMMIVMTR